MTRMVTTEDRVAILEGRMKTLETWAGPGQVEALSEGQRAIRAELTKLRADVAKIQADMAKVQKTQDRHSADVAELKSMLQEVLRRLPPPGRG